MTPPRSSALPPPCFQAWEAALLFLLLPVVSSAITTWPTLRSTFRDPRNERPASWFVSAGSDLAVAAAVLAEGLEWQYLVYPGRHDADPGRDRDSGARPPGAGSIRGG